MKKYFFLLTLLIFFIPFCSALFIKGSGSYMETNYTQGEVLQGMLNLSLSEHPSNSKLKLFNSSVNIIELLKNSNAVYFCSPNNCDAGDYSSENPSPTKSFSLGYGGESRVVGLKLDGKLLDNPISEISFIIDSDSSSTCYEPLQIDFLDDGITDWYFNEPTQIFECSVYPGCFESTETLTEGILDENKYCQKMILSNFPAFEIGARIIKGSTPDVEFTFGIYDSTHRIKSCKTSDIPGNSGEEVEVTCIVNLTLTEPGEYYICINANKTTDYKINTETNEPCGYANNLDYEFTTDYDIFVRGAKYSGIQNIKMNNTEFLKFSPISLKDYLNSYLLEEYDNDCSGGCVIPIKFISGISQEITLSNLELNYKKTGLTTTSNQFYDIGEGHALINASFQELDLSKAGLNIPDSTGQHTAVLTLDDTLLLSEQIRVGNGSKILGLYPKMAAASVPTIFTVKVSEPGIKYEWDFGDGLIEETAGSSTIHTYSYVGDYSVKVNIENNQGAIISKSFNLKVISPKDLINSTLQDKKNNLKSLQSDLDSITSWYAPIIEQQLNLEEINTELKKIETQYKLALEESEYALVMSDLIGLEIPESIEETVSTGEYFPDPYKIIVSNLIDFGAKEVVSPEDYNEEIVAWFNEHINMEIESKIYSLTYPDYSQIPFLTSFKLKIIPLENINKKTYLILDSKGIAFKEDYGEEESDWATGIVFTKLTQEQNIEFILGEGIEITELPIFISPEFSQLNSVDISPCNFNKRCESELGENSSNCRNDCFPWKTMAVGLIVLFIISFAVYIALQQWYKVKYETYLFKDRRNLFNLVSFMNNALNQGLTRKELTKKLKEKGWKGEQIAYAFKKVKGKRTGMLEIPIFNIFKIKKKEKVPQNSPNLFGKSLNSHKFC